MTPAPDHIAELALIEMSKLQRWAVVFAIPDEPALAIAADCLSAIEHAEQLAELARSPALTRQETRKEAA